MDAQVHVWGRNTPQRPWVQGKEHLAWWPEYTAQELLLDMDAAGVDAAVLIPPGAFEDYRNELAIEAVRRAPARFAAMGQVDFRQPQAAERLEQLIEEPALSGMRFSFAADSNRELFLGQRLDWAFKLLADRGKPLMIYAPGCLDEIGAVARRHERLRLAICHMNLDKADQPLPLLPRIAALLALARLPNVSVKASALSLQSHQPYLFADVHAALESVLAAFGPGRVFWGTDITRLDCSYRQARDFFLALPFLTGTALELVMGEALRHWLDWPLVHGEAATAR